MISRVVFKRDQYGRVLRKGDFAVGDDIVISGVSGQGVIKAFKRSADDPDIPEVVVVSWKGYGENPGSRYSGLYSYYPATTEVFTLNEIKIDGDVKTPIYVPLISWRSRPEKKRS